MKVFNQRLWLISAIIIGLVTAVLVVGLIVGTYYQEVINIYLNAQTQIIVPEEGATIYYWTDYDDEEILKQHERKVCRDIVEEGATLLLNKNKTLPLANGSKVSCFSQSSVDPIYAGTGSASISSDDVVTLNAALRDSFGENSTNTELVKFYTASGYKRVNAALTGGSPDQYRINEVPWSKYSEPLKNTFSAYGDAAIVVLARSGGEGADLPNSMKSLEPYMTDGDYLKLCAEEADLLSNLKSLKDAGTFKRIIILLNTANIMQLDFLEKYDVDALLWTGNVGLTGFSAVADILSGAATPSGRIVDTFLKNNHSSPAIVNFGAYDYTNAAEYKLEGAQNNSDAGIAKCNRYYVAYQEGIYVGYRYYETRYEDYVLGRGNTGTYSYDDDVAYPFGSGLSYMDFTYSNFNITEKNDKFEVTVDVKNEGERAVKHTVQIYYQSEYTQYDIDNDVEKAAVEICGFEKKEISAKSTRQYSIIVDKKDLTSYDHMKEKTYILEDGDYYFTVGEDAHNAVNNILMAKKADGVTVNESRMSGTAGNAALAKKWENKTFDKTTYAISNATDNAITNLFDNADINKYSGTSGQKITYLTRNDWTGTFPKSAVTLKVTDKMWEDGLTHDESGKAALADKYKEAYYPDATIVPNMGVSGDLKVADLCEVEITDNRWDELIAQVKYDELTNLICNGMYATQSIKSIGLPETRAADGPYGFTKPLSGGGRGMCFPCEGIVAATFNPELVYKQGKFMAEDLIHASIDNSNTFYTAIYAPGANIHRTTYSGRNGEYYSEDGYVSGVMCSSAASGMRSKGITAVAKHYALNDQEEGRYGISTWSNEQAIREVYLEGFEEFVIGGGTAVMSSFNRLGVVWSGAHHGLMTGVLRDEWGLKGMAITDMAQSARYMDYRLGLFAGQDIWLGFTGGTISSNSNDAAIVVACQTAAKRIIYTVSRTHAMNIGRADIIKIMPWWKILIIILLAVCAAVTVSSAVMFIISIKKQKQYNKISNVL